MSGFSVYLDNALLNDIFAGPAYPTPTKYLALFSSDAGLETNEVSAQQEIVGGGYTRVAMPNTIFTEAANSFVTNNLAVEFPEATGDWNEVSHMAITDAETAGNILCWGELINPVTGEAQPRLVFTSDQLVLRYNALSIRILNQDGTTPDEPTDPATDPGTNP